MAPKRLIALPASGVVALAASGIASAGNGGLAPVTPASKAASTIQDTYFVTLGLAGALLLAVVGFLVVAVVRGARGGGRPLGPRLPLVAAGTALVALAIVGAFSLAKLDGVKNPPSGGDRLAVQAKAGSGGWTVTYPDGKTETGALHIREGQVVTIALTADGLEQQWWVPALGGATVAAPGVTRSTWIQATHTGTFRSEDPEAPLAVTVGGAGGG